MIEQEKGLLYLVKLNKTSFEQNPGKFYLPEGKYVAEIREGTFSYKMGFSSDVELKTNGRKIRFPELGKFESEDKAKSVYQGMAVEFDHNGGDIEVYNYRSAKQYFRKTEGYCTVGIWDGKMFGSPDGVFESGEYKPNSDNILILTSNPDAKPYSSIDGNLKWQSDLKDFNNNRVLIIPQESFSFLYKIRDKNCLDKYIRSGGRIYFVGSSLKYLSYYNVVPFDLPWYMGNKKFNIISSSKGDKALSNREILNFNSSMSIPIIYDNGLVNLNRNNACLMNRFESKYKIAWSSFFLLDHDNTANWNDLVYKQIDWLLGR